MIHQIAGELFVDRLNASGGLLGRPVEWTVLDDESDQAQVTTLYERLISQDQVDLIIGPTRRRTSCRRSPWPSATGT